MRKTFYLLWGAWLLIGIILKILHLVSWWAATSAIWFPLLVGLSVLLLITLTSHIGERQKEKLKTKPSCENCLYAKTADLINATRKEGDEKFTCMGERLGAGTRGTLCSHWQEG